MGQDRKTRNIDAKMKQPLRQSNVHYLVGSEPKPLMDFINNFFNLLSFQRAQVYGMVMV